MPATEQTWRNQKVMHVVFGASALVMTIATLWLLAKDHNREWKDWQLKARSKDAWVVQSSRDALADQYAARMASYESDLQLAQSSPIERTLLEEFERIVTQEDARLAGQVADAEQATADATGGSDQFANLRELAEAMEGKIAEAAGLEGDDASGLLAEIASIRANLTGELTTHIAKPNAAKSDLLAARRRSMDFGRRRQHQRANGARRFDPGRARRDAAPDRRFRRAARGVDAGDCRGDRLSYGPREYRWRDHGRAGIGWPKKLAPWKLSSRGSTKSLQE